jgi:CRISPR/Cas system CSM-associated protein Csm3 (group 7 of RAMP superfamily)
MKAQWQNPRGIKERIIVQGTLVLDTPAHLGNGDTDGPLDMPLLLDPLESKALLTGTSIAGALRSYVQGYSEEMKGIVSDLFGDVKQKESIQSHLIVDDALGQEPKVELRDGVAIKPLTRTAEDKKKFDMELLISGTEFELSFELLLPKNKENELLQSLAIALQGLEKGEIRIGKRKRRGFGRCHVSQWTICRYNMTNPKGLIAWLDKDLTGQQKGRDIVSLLGVTVLWQETSQKRTCTLEGTFALKGSLFIRSNFGDANAPDFVHLHSMRDNKDVPILSGTSLAGALRARALRIANTLGKNGLEVIDSIFGNRRYEDGGKKKLTASRLVVEESVIQNPFSLVHSRVKIDRFTGGSYPSALFSEQPVFGKLVEESTLKIELKLEKACEKDIGLLLLLLKDLWTGDLPLGGECSVGRGRLNGRSALLNFDGCSWIFSQDGDGPLQLEGDKSRLEEFVRAFVEAK